jgi:UDP-N-acetylmuramoyl-tripeptide--D-alanyl-D-alanine ligase
VAVALELGVAVDEVARRLATLPTAPHRLEAAVGTGGVHVLDDTYNANPAGSRAALGALTRAGDPDKRRVVVTPGMVELGPVQAEENAAFARAAADVATDLVVVGRTNRRALLQGWRGVAGAGAVVVVPTRQQATGWVRSHLGEGDAVLYENDLPDHYP